MGAYVLSTIVNVFKGINRKLTVSCDDFTASGKHALICACNGRFYGGGFNPSLEAMPNDGLLDIFVVKAVNIFQLAMLIGRYSKGQAHTLTKFVTHLRSDNLQIAFEDVNVIQADGEAMFDKNVSIRLVPAALNLIVPKGMAFFEKKQSVCTAENA